jgi:hypothetical protein
MSFRFSAFPSPKPRTPSFRAFVIGITETIGLLAAGSADGCFFRFFRAGSLTGPLRGRWWVVSHWS